MHARSRALPTVLLALLLPATATAGITSPTKSSAGVDPNGFYDVFGPDAPLTWTSTGSCTLGPVSGSQPSVNANDTRVFTTSDVAGLWVLTCGGDAFTFYQGVAHRQLWLDHNDMATLADEYANRTSAVLSQQKQTSAPPVDVDPTWDDRWVHDTAWYYVLNVALHDLAYEPGGTRVPNESGAALPSGSGLTAATAWAGSTEDLRAWPSRIERLGVAAMLYDAYNATDGTASDYGSKDRYLDDDATGTAGDNDGQYLDDGLVYWGDYLANTSAWSTPFDICSSCDSNNDLIRADLLIALSLAYDWAYPELSVDQRRVWRKKIYDEVEAFYAEPAADWRIPEAGEQFPPPPATPLYTWPNVTLRRVREGHMPADVGAIGIASNVLYEEMQTTGLSGNRTAWSGDAETYFALQQSLVGTDGGDTAGANYFVDNLDYYLKYAESNRLDPALAPYVDTDWYGAWVMNTPRYFLQLTAGDLDRSRMSDSEHLDWKGPGWLWSRIADEGSDDLAQRLAWLGHNPLSYVTTNTRKDPLDLLWYQTSLAPMADADFEDPDVMPTHRCSEYVGIVSARSDDSGTGTQLLFHGGPLFGDHEFPQIGAFSLWKNDWLVTFPGPETRSPSGRRPPPRC